MKMDVLSIIYVLFFISFRVSRYEFKERLAFSKELSIYRIHEIANYVFNIFSDWPNAFLRFIEEFRIIPKSQKHTSGLERDFGTFYMLFYKQLQGKDYQELRKQFEHYLITKWEGGFLTERTVKKFLVQDTRMFLTGEDASKELGVHYATLVELIETQRIEGIIIPGKINNQILVRRESIEKYKHERSQGLFH